MSIESTSNLLAEVERRSVRVPASPCGRAFVQGRVCCGHLIATAAMLLIFDGCAALQYEGGVNKHSTAPEYPDRDRQPPPAEKLTFRF